MRGSLSIMMLLGLTAAPPRPAAEHPDGTSELFDAWVSFADNGFESDAARRSALGDLERSFEAGPFDRG